jgi:hypothetical protein
MMLAYSRGSVRRCWFGNEDGSIRLTLEGPTRAYALCKFGSCGAHLSDVHAFAPYGCNGVPPDLYSV